MNNNVFFYQLSNTNKKQVGNDFSKQTVLMLTT